jgi:NADH:ubiquinone oxidoreductase subunit E
MANEGGACACAAAETDAERNRRLDELIADYRTKPGGLIPVLQIAQGMFGYLPRAVLIRIAEGMGRSYSEVAGVVSFYSFFTTTPRGKHLIRVCLGTACYVRGGRRVLEAFKQRLGVDVGQTTEDRLFTLEVARCFGACGLAPAITIDDEVIHRVKPVKVGEILGRYREGAERAPKIVSRR